MRYYWFPFCHPLFSLYLFSLFAFDSLLIFSFWVFSNCSRGLLSLITSFDGSNSIYYNSEDLVNITSCWLFWNALYFSLSTKMLRLQLWYKLLHSICLSQVSKSPRFTGKPQAFWFYPSLIYQPETQESSAFTFPMEHNHEKHSSLINNLFPFSCIIL